MSKLNIQPPHWLSVVAGVLAASSVALAASTSPLLQPYDPLFVVLGTLFSALATFNVTTKT